MRQVRSRLDDIEEKLREQNENTVKRWDMLAENTDRTKAIQVAVEKHDAAIFGNGKPGLLAEVQAMKQSMKIATALLSMIAIAVVSQLVAFLSRAHT